MITISNAETDKVITTVDNRTMVFWMMLINLSAGVIEARVKSAAESGEGLQLGTFDFDPHLAVALQIVLDPDHPIIEDASDGETAIMEHLLDITAEDIDLRDIQSFLLGEQSEQTD